MKRLIRQLLMIGRTLEYGESLEHLQRVTREDVVRAVEERVHSEQFSLLVYGGRRLGALRRAAFGF